jgi:hypothetical protein
VFIRCSFYKKGQNMQQVIGWSVWENSSLLGPLFIDEGEDSFYYAAGKFHPVKWSDQRIYSDALMKP